MKFVRDDPQNGEVVSSNIERAVPRGVDEEDEERREEKEKFEVINQIKSLWKVRKMSKDEKKESIEKFQSAGGIKKAGLPLLKEERDRLAGV